MNREKHISNARTALKIWSNVLAGLERTQEKTIYLMTDTRLLRENKWLATPEAYLKNVVRFEVLATDNNVTGRYMTIQYSILGMENTPYALETVSRNDLPLYVSMKHTYPGLEKILKKGVPNESR